MKALLVIDIQKGLTKKKLYNDSVFIDTVNGAIKKYNDYKYLVVYIQHNSNQLKDGTEDWEIDSRINKDITNNIIQKNHGNSFEKTGLKSILDNSNVKEILVCGLVTHGCVKATCLGGLNEGFKTSLLRNGHTSWSTDAKERVTKTETELKQAGVLILDINEI